MIMYQMIDGVYEPSKFGSNIVPTENIDKVIQVPEEIAMQALKFDFDGETLKRKEGKYIMSLEEYKESERQNDIQVFGGNTPFAQQEEEANKIKIEF